MNPNPDPGRFSMVIPRIQWLFCEGFKILMAELSIGQFNRPGASSPVHFAKPVGFIAKREKL
jgi:hypothetical protein